MKKNNFKYYLSTFLMVFAFVIILLIMAHSKGNYFIGTSIEPKGKWAEEYHVFLYKNQTFIKGKYFVDLIAIIAVPLFFALMFAFVDFITNALKSKKKKAKETEEAKYDKFIDGIGAKLNETKMFNPEDFRHFRENNKFQECLKKLYQIYVNGETKEVNYFLLLRKFEKGTSERKAIEYLINYTEKLRGDMVVEEDTNEQL